MCGAALLAVFKLPSLGSYFEEEGLDRGTLVTDFVRTAPFRVTVRERGELDSLKNSTITSDVEGTTTIISIVPEGQHVKEGDVLCELDASVLVDQEKQQQILLTQADADLKKADEAVQIQLRQNESDQAAAQLALDLGELDLKKFLEGERRQQINEHTGTKELKEEEYLRSKQAYEFAVRLTQKGYQNQNDLEAARIKMVTAKIDLDVAKEKLDVLVNYMLGRTEKELQEKAAEAKRQLERVQRQGEAALAQLKAEASAKTLQLEVEKSKLERLQKQIAACTLRAPQDGQVVYASERSRRSEGNIIEAGAQVRQRQTIIKLPDLTQMKVNARIHESRISLVREGLPVVVRVDAVAGRTFRGVVDSVSSVPLSSNWMRPDLKEYEASIRITEDPEAIKELKPGLNAVIEIIAEERSNVLQVPMQSVVSVAGKTYAYVVTAKGAQRRELLVGKSNNKTVEIIDGLADGEEIILNPRSAFADELGELQEAGRTKKEDAAEGEGEEQSGEATPGAEGAEAGSSEKADGERRGGGASRFGQMDANKDGKISQDEMPERFRTFFPNLDTNSDGGLDAAEWQKAEQAAAGGGAGGAGAEAGK